MAYTITHVLVVVLLVELFRIYFIKNNYKFPRYYILIAAFAAILPDLDIIAVYALYPFGFAIEQVHRTFLHSIFVPLILFVIGLIIWKAGWKISELRKRHVNLPFVFFVLAFGSFIHLVLDFIVGGYFAPFYPFIDWKIGLDLIGYFPEELRNIILVSLDTFLFFLWLFWMVFKLKISKYI